MKGMNQDKARYKFTPKIETLNQIMTNRQLSQLGDAFVNFACSLALSVKQKKPVGTKVSSQTLAQALKNANLRKHLPARMTRHALADAAEALVVYAWLSEKITIDETVRIIQMTSSSVDGLTQLLRTVVEKLMLS